MSCAEVIKEIRINMCLSQNEFAKKIRVSVPSVSNYEAGIRIPRFPVIRRIRSVAEEAGVRVPAVEEFLA